MYRNYVCALVVGAALGASPAAAQLVLELDAADRAPVLGEPPALQAVLRNTGAERVRVHRHLGPEYDAVTYLITHPDGRTARAGTWAIKEAARPFTVLAPGEAVTDGVDLFFDGRDWVFDEPGTYVIRARYPDDVEAEPLTLEVRAPATAEQRRQAALVLGTPQAGLFLLLKGGDHLDEGRAVLEQIVRDAPNGVVADHAAFALGYNLLQPFRDFANDSVRPAQPAAAARYLEAVDIGELNVERAVEARVGLAIAHRRTGRVEPSRSVRDEVEAALGPAFPALASVDLDALAADARRRLERR